MNDFLTRTIPTIQRGLEILFIICGILFPFLLIYFVFHLSLVLTFSLIHVIIALSVNYLAVILIVWLYILLDNVLAKIVIKNLK